MRDLSNRLSVAILATNQPNLSETLDSLDQLQCPIYLLGAEEEGTITVAGDWEHDFSIARNRIQSHIKTPWVLHIDSDEMLSPLSLEPLLEVVQTDPRIIKTSIHQMGAQVLQPRLVPTGSVWKRRSHEVPTGDFPIDTVSDIILNHRVLESEDRIKKSLYNFALISKEWEKSGDPDALFLCAVDGTFLTPEKGEYYARTFLSQFSNLSSKKGREQNLLISYALAYLEGVFQKDIPQAIRRIRNLIAKDPSFCEFWCLLGDLYLRLKSPVQAREMFENAIIIGSQMDVLDTNRIWIDMDKYSEYPMARVQYCEKLASQI